MTHLLPSQRDRGHVGQKSWSVQHLSDKHFSCSYDVYYTCLEKPSNVYLCVFVFFFFVLFCFVFLLFFLFFFSNILDTVGRIDIGL